MKSISLPFKCLYCKEYFTSEVSLRRIPHFQVCPKCGGTKTVPADVDDIIY